MKQILYKSHSYIGFYVYYLIDKKEIVYIGCTFNLNKRLGEHSQWLPINKNYTHLVKKQFTHYSCILLNNEQKARLLESKEIKKYKPKYNNHTDYRWVPTGKKYIMYKISGVCRGVGNTELNYPTKLVYHLMTWKRKKNVQSDTKE
jgi:predicted GIY-YIG superfamily endonuclease